jgi:hypothetical protein
MDYSYIHNANVSGDLAYKIAHQYDNYDNVEFSADEYRTLLNEIKNESPNKTKSRIKVLENNYKKDNIEQNNENIDEDLPIQVICEHCDSKLEITKDDTYIGWLGARFIKCPCCGREAMIDELDGITLTVDNIDFPAHFLRVNKNERHVKEVDAKEIVKDIRRGIEYFREHKDKYSWYTSYGDMFLTLLRYDGDEEYYVVVTKDYYETSIPFEEVDYGGDDD